MSDVPSDPFANIGRGSTPPDGDPGDPVDAVDVDGDPSARTRGRPSSSVGRQAISWILTIAIALGLTIVVKTWAFQAYVIPSESMVPTLEVGDRVLVAKFNTDPGRGDIIVFDRPDEKRNPTDPDVLIKRVIGLPGETVGFVDGDVWIDGARLEEDYLSDDVTTEFDGDIEVPEGELLVLGDNRNSSQDGRVFGTISKDLIVGRAVMRIWPLGRMGRI